MSQAWASFSDLKERYSPAELSFEMRRRTIGLFLGPLVFALLLIMPTPAGMTWLGQEVLGISAWTILWWITEPIPIPATALLPFVLIPVMGVMQPTAAYAIFGHPNTLLMLGAYIITQGLITHGAARRFAVWMLSRSWVGNSPTRLLLTFLGASALLSSVMSNIPVTMLFLAVGTGILGTLKISTNSNYAKSLALASAYGAQAGGFMTPIGAISPNFLMIALIGSVLHYQIRFADWCLWGIPFGLLSYAVMAVYFLVFLKPDTASLGNASVWAKEELRKMGPMTRGERNSVFAIVLAMVLWFFPSVVAAIYGSTSPTSKFFDTALEASAVSLGVAALMFLLPINWKERKFTMTWPEANKGVEWGILLLVAAGLLLGTAMGLKEVGLMTYAAKALSGLIGGTSPMLAVLGMTAVTVLLTQFLPNPPTIAVMVPISITVATAIGANPVAMALTVGIAAQQSYALPISAPQMALAYGAGYMKITEFTKYGTLLSIIMVFVTAIVMYYLTGVVYPFAAK